MGGGHQMILVGVQMSSLPSGWILQGLGLLGRRVNHTR
jgi:hypothetical protein